MLTSKLLGQLTLPCSGVTKTDAQHILRHPLSSYLFHDSLQLKYLGGLLPTWWWIPNPWIGPYSPRHKAMFLRDPTCTAHSHLHRCLLPRGLNLSLMFPNPHFHSESCQEISSTCALSAPSSLPWLSHSSHAPTSLSLFFFLFGDSILPFIYFFYLWWILSYIEMKQRWVSMCSPSQSPLPPPSPPIPSRFSQCTRSERLYHASNLGWWSVSP